MKAKKSPAAAAAASAAEGGSAAAARAGRPTKLTGPLITRICTHVRAGNFLETAALACGVTRQSLYNWLRTANEALEAGYGEEPDPAAASVPAFTALEELCVEFLTAMEQATAEADIADMAIIEAAAETDWRAAAWRTARRDRRKEYDSAQGAERLCFAPGAPAMAAAPAARAAASRPSHSMPAIPISRFPTAEETAASERYRAARRGEYLTWKTARDAQAAAGTALTPAEEAYDKRNARNFEHEAWRVKMEPLWAKLERDKEEKAARDLAAWRGADAKSAAENVAEAASEGAAASSE